MAKEIKEEAIEEIAVQDKEVEVSKDTKKEPELTKGDKLVKLSDVKDIISRSSVNMFKCASGYVQVREVQAMINGIIADIDKIK